jgi:phage terminase large subunit-like protein
MQIRRKTEADYLTLVPECNFTQAQAKILAYNLPPHPLIAKYAINQTPFLKVVPRLEVREDPLLDDDGDVIGYEPVILKNVTTYVDHDGVTLYYYDKAEGERWIEFIEDYIKHVKGEWRGKPFKLSPWQVWLIMEFFSWRRLGTALRRYSDLFLYCPRKNGKTLLIAAICLGFLLIDGEQAPEIYNMGSAQTQSDTLFELAQFNCGYKGGKEFASEELIERTEVQKAVIMSHGNGGTFLPLPFSPDAFHGKNPTLAVLEEYHAHKTDEMREVGETGQGARRQPATLIDTTAGENRDSPCFEELLRARNVNDGTVIDPTYLPVLFESPDTDEWPWDALKTAALVNPQFGISLFPEFFVKQISKAKLNPLRKRRYKQLQLNVFVEDAKCAFDYDEWVRGRTNFHITNFKDCKLYGGFDLAATDDLTALVLVALPDGLYGDWYCHSHFWCPETTVTTRKTIGNYELWAERGYLVKTPGNATDYDYIQHQIAAYNKYFEIGFMHGDRANATHLSNKLQLEEGLKFDYMGQGVLSMTEPIKFLITLVKSGRLKHNNPIMDWMCKNVILHGNDRACKFEKLSQNVKIDGFVALAMAVSAALRMYEETESTGVRVW